MHLDRQLC